MIKLSKRLEAIADFAKSGRRIADIGTDHAYIPVFLTQLGNAERIIAADVKSGPLARAESSASEYGVSDKIEFKLTDGLRDIAPDLDTVIIAGMGGETIISILSEAPWTKREGVTLVLQPQSKIEILIKWLCTSGYEIDDARLVKDAGRIYTVFRVTGGEKCDDVELIEQYVCGKLVKNGDPLLGEYIENLERKVEKSLEQMTNGGTLEDKKYEEQHRLLIEIKRVQEEINNGKNGKGT